MNSAIPFSFLQNKKLEKKLLKDYPFQKPDDLKLASLECKKKYYNIVKQLSKDLNKIHNLNWPLRSWKILIGPWLARFIETTYEKWGIIKVMQRQNKITYNISKDDYNFTCFDMDDFANKTQSLYWNEQILSYLIKKYTNLKLKKKLTKEKNFSNKFLYKKTFIEKILYSISKNLRIFQKKDDGVIYRSYIAGFFNKLLLNLKLKQFPQIYFTNEYQQEISKLELMQIFKNNTNKRKEFVKIFKLKLNSEKEKKFNLILQDLIKKTLPRVYLENFDHLKLISEKRKIFPEKPKFIFTSCSPMLKDEEFKFWVSNQIIKKTKLFLIQHGGVYGTSYFTPTVPRHEVDISDIFLSWSNSKKAKIKKIPCPIILSRNFKWNKKGNILLIFTESREYFTTFQCDSLWGERSKIYHKDQTNFINSLPKYLFDDMNFRFHPGNKLCKENILRGISNHRSVSFKKKIIENKNFIKIMSCHRLLIFNYNSTGFLEGIGSNRPSILFLNNSIMPFRDSEKSFFMELKKVGILHFNQKSLINHLKKISLDVEKWWESKEVIIARKKFCQRFVDYKDNYLDEYFNVLLT